MLALILLLTVECQRYFQYHKCISFENMNITGLLFFLIRAGREVCTVPPIPLSSAYRDMINIWFPWLELTYHANLLPCSGHFKFFDRLSLVYSISVSFCVIKIHWHDLNWTLCRPVIQRWWAQNNSFDRTLETSDHSRYCMISSWYWLAVSTHLPH